MRVAREWQPSGVRRVTFSGFPPNHPHCCLSTHACRLRHNIWHMGSTLPGTWGHTSGQATWRRLSEAVVARAWTAMIPNTPHIGKKPCPMLSPARWRWTRATYVFHAQRCPARASFLLSKTTLYELLGSLKAFNRSRRALHDTGRLPT